MSDDLTVIAEIEKIIKRKLDGCYKLKEDRVAVLDLSFCRLSDISTLDTLMELKQLEVLYLYNNQLSDISILNSLTQLKEFP